MNRLLKLKISKDTEISTDLINRLIELHSFEIAGYLARQQYYEGKHDILAREVDEKSRPNNKLVNNHAKYITDVANGYFLGMPVTYNSKDTNYNKSLQDIFEKNNESDENSEMGKQCGIKGICYELLYLNEAGEIKFKYVKAEEGFLVYDDTIEENVMFGVRYYLTKNILTNEEITKIEVYTASTGMYYEKRDSVTALISETPHYFQEVPLIEYINNEEQQGDFEQVITLINAYNDSQSNTANDFEYFSDAYLVLSGMSGTESTDIAEMKKQRVLLVDENGQAAWLTKEINDQATENYKNRLQKDIHLLSNVPKLTDEDFAGNLSGVALRFKLWGLEQLAVNKERKFKSSLQQRLKIITNILNIKGNVFDYSTVDISFYRNIPQNILEIVQMVTSIGDTVSEQTKLEQLPFVDDVQEEIKRKEEEYQKKLDEYQMNEGAMNEGQTILAGQGNTEGRQGVQE